MKKTWILVANGSLARIFSRTSANAALLPVETIHHPEGRLKGHELERDRHGRGNSDNSTSVTHFEARTSLRNKQRAAFARELAQRLDQGLADHEYAHLGIAASMPLLGALKGALGDAVQARLAWLHEADFTALDLGSLERRLSELSPPLH